VSKKRLDLHLLSLGIAENEKLAKALIMAGKVIVDGVKLDKPGTLVKDTCKVEVLAQKEYVGRGAYKLLGAIKSFQIDINGKVCADVGASTGGFTEVMLRSGASKVYAIDVGFGELDYKLRSDPRVVVLERTNARHLSYLPEKVSFVSIDVSFISLKQILPTVKDWLNSEAEIVCLVKPQFEAEKHEVAEGGLILNPLVQQRVSLEIMNSVEDLGLQLRGFAKSELDGTHGNKEFFLWCSNFGEKTLEADNLINTVFRQDAF
jgi:23S rRNA (cytidine1920-2'-O)/16S rRNA (cytidine1409-2'-O)-methyltransferase